MDNGLKIKLYSVVIDSNDAQGLATFYAKLLDWLIVYSDDEFTVIGPPGTAQGAYPGITFQQNPDYVPPVWPEQPGAQQQMEHLDFAVNDMTKAVEYAKLCGATVAPEQFSEHWTVMLDPSGHPFCLCDMKPVFHSPAFGLQ